MRKLRKSLIHLFQRAWQSTPLAGRAKATIIQQAIQLLRDGNNDQVGISYRLLSHGNLHRYIMVVHCPDQAFYPDAIRTYLQKRNIQPIQQQSVLFSLKTEGEPVVSPEMDKHHNALFLVYHFSAATTEHIELIEKDIHNVLSGVHLSVVDFPLMCSELERMAIYMAEDNPVAAELLQWMLAEHYLLFGLEYTGQTRKNKGVCRNKRTLAKLIPGFAADLETVAPATEPGLHWLNLPSTFSHLYSATNVKAVRISWLEHDQLFSAILLGHFSRGARYINSSLLPQLKECWAEMARDFALQQSAFYQREVLMLFDRAPKSLLHSIPPQQWLEPFKNIVNMNNPTQIVVSRLVPMLGGVEYLLVAIDRHRFGNNIWNHMQRELVKLKFQLLGFEYFSVGSTQLVFVAVHNTVWPDNKTIEKALTPCIVFWKDRAKKALLSADLPSHLLHSSLLELSNISGLYEGQFPPEQFVRDLVAREKLKQNGQTQVRVSLLQQESHQVVEVQILMPEAMPLGLMTEKLNAFALVTMEQSLIPFHDAGQQMNICRFRCQAPEQLHPEGLSRLREGIEDVFNKLAPHDSLNALLVLCGLTIRDVMVLITLRNHLVQMMADVSHEALSQVMIRQARVSLCLFRLFEGKHRPGMPVSFFEQARLDFNKAMVDVQILKEDTWFRGLATIVLASLRSNAWQRQKGEALAIKVDSAQLQFAPRPLPYREIFVNGVSVEGVHLRAGPIARGGLRYSDRPTDYRTEVLELMSTQVVKNGQIVPTGAKGGFVVKDESTPAFVQAQYRQFIRALLSVTDNRLAGELVPPADMNIPAGDSDDPYLVVAADKGTARLSDAANAESLAANYWLGDAFASGGSHGYDHKAFGITARGAWECAAHHFARMGRDLWSDEIVAVGIGDMSGDVFGNGLLLNPQMKLVAAFNHVHIFLDPEPDVAAAFGERRRLFVEGKGWGSYDKSLISEGGGVFDRGAKSIMLTESIQRALGFTEKSCSGEALIRAILQAPVDLLYNGGIGTYVKASFESHADAQDPTNNAVRVDADTLRCKVVSEGGNLGFTQASRIEFAQHQGIINTDAIDNAAGVNMSDHEVNLKVLLGNVPFKQRNRVLRSVAEDVAAQCLRDNREQAIALSFMEIAATRHLPRLQYLQRFLHKHGYLSRIEEDESRFALRPVFAEWLGYEKNRVHQALDEEGFHSRSVFGEIFLLGYFPLSLRKRYHEEILQHPLANEISHTRITSHIVNRYGLTSIYFLQNLMEATVAEVVQALLVAEFLMATDQMAEEAFASADVDLERWYQVQQQVLSFAEGLLAYESHMDVTMAWLQATRKTMHAYAREKQLQFHDFAPLVTAVPLSEAEGVSLHRCLAATEQCLQVLPFSALETALRSPLWASADAHALRCEWLSRLMLLKIHAGKKVLYTPAKKRELLLRQWREHGNYNRLFKLLQGHEQEGEEEQRLHYILAMTLLQGIVET